MTRWMNDWDPSTAALAFERMMGAGERREKQIAEGLTPSFPEWPEEDEVDEDETVSELELYESDLAEYELAEENEDEEGIELE